jgi:hypothetical protein
MKGRCSICRSKRRAYVDRMVGPIQRANGRRSRIAPRGGFTEAHPMTFAGRLGMRSQRRVSAGRQPPRGACGWANLSSEDTNDRPDVCNLRIAPHIYSYAWRNGQAGHNCGALPCATRTPAFTPTIANPRLRQLLRHGLSVSAHRLSHRSADEHRQPAVGDLSSGLDILWSHCVSWPSTRGASGSVDEPDRHLNDQPKRASGPESHSAVVGLANQARDAARAKRSKYRFLT